MSVAFLFYFGYVAVRFTACDGFAFPGPHMFGSYAVAMMLMEFDQSHA